MSGVEKIGTNSGHGHAWERPDGMKMRCGGPRMCKSCGMDAALVANVLAAGKDALSAIEGGGGALQPSASVPTEQADGGVVAALETACRVLRGIPKPRTNDGVSIVYSVSDDVPEDIYTAQSYVEHAMFLLARATPPATPIAGDVLTLDRWGILEQLAKAAIADNDNPCIFAATQSLDTFNQSANPAAILELIAAARQQPNREG